MPTATKSALKAARSAARQAGAAIAKKPPAQRRIVTTVLLDRLRILGGIPSELDTVGALAHGLPDDLRRIVAAEFVVEAGVASQAPPKRGRR